MNFSYWEILMNASVSIGVIDLLKLIIWLTFSFGKKYLSRKSPISFKFSNFLGYIFLKYDLRILWMSFLYGFKYSFLFLILLLGCFLSQSFSSLYYKISIWLIFPKKFLFVSLIFHISFLLSILMICIPVWLFSAIW